MINGEIRFGPPSSPRDMAQEDAGPAVPRSYMTGSPLRESGMLVLFGRCWTKRCLLHPQGSWTVPRAQHSHSRGSRRWVLEVSDGRATPHPTCDGAQRGKPILSALLVVAGRSLPAVGPTLPLWPFLCFLHAHTERPKSLCVFRNADPWGGSRRIASSAPA